MPPVTAESSAFLLTRSGTGWAVQESETRPDGFLYAGLASLSPARTLSCPASVARDPARVLTCLAEAEVTQIPPPLQAQLTTALGCSGAWPATSLVSREAACAAAPPARGQPGPTSTTAPVDRSAPTSPPAGSAGAGAGSQSGSGGSAPPFTPPLTVTFSENPVVCDGNRRPFGTVSGAYPDETLTFRAAGIGELRPGEANDAGQVTVHWRCDPGAVGQTWALEAAGESSGRTVSFTLTGGPATLASAAPAPPGSLQVALYSPTFACDGTRRPAGAAVGGPTG